MMMMYQFLPRALLKYFPIGLGLMVIGIYCMFVVLVYILESKQGTFDTFCVGCGTTCILILYWCLYLTARFDPGYASKDVLIVNADQPAEGTVRFCQVCNIIKPERGHHCSKCRRCVLNMDHHCMWTANCIGLHNRKSFNLILFWGSLGMVFATMLGFANFEFVYLDFKIHVAKSEFFNSIRCLGTMLMIVTQSINAVGLIYFFLTNFYLVLGNTTTLDDLRPNSTTVNPYDLGQWYNFTFYFGTNPVLWFFPVGKPLGDGYHWDKKATNVQLSVHE